MNMGAGAHMWANQVPLQSKGLPQLVGDNCSLPGHKVIFSYITLFSIYDYGCLPLQLIIKASSGVQMSYILLKVVWSSYASPQFPGGIHYQQENQTPTGCWNQRHSQSLYLEWKNEMVSVLFPNEAWLTSM